MGLTESLDLWTCEVITHDKNTYEIYGQWVANNHIYWMILHFTFNLI